MSADVLQMGMDAARTGVSDDAGPKLDEVAWTIQLPGSVSRNPPLIIGDNAYIVTSDLRHRDDLDQNAIWRVSMADGSATPIIALDDAGSSQFGGEIGGQTIPPGRIAFPHAAVTDGERFYVAGPERVVVYDLASGAEQWQWAYPVLTFEQEFVYCAPPALTGRLLVLGCTAFGEAPGDVGDEGDQIAQIAQFVAALDLEAEQEVWAWVRNPTMEAFNEDTPANPTCTPLAGGGPCGLLYRAPMIVGVSTFGPIVVASILSVIEPPTGTEYKAIVALDVNTGQLRWVQQTTQDAAPQDDDEEGFIQFSFMPTGDEVDGYLAFRDLLRVNPATGAAIEEFDLAPRDELTTEVATSFALTEDRLFFTTARTLYSIDRYDLTTEHWVTPLPSQSTGAWDYEPLTYADGVLYGRVTDGFQERDAVDLIAQVAAEDTSHMQAYNALTGELIWSHTIVADFAPRALTLHSYTVAAGLMLVAGQDGRVVAIGRTDASLRPQVTWPSEYPAVGEQVTIDASDTPASTWAGATASTEPSEFRVDWGDGTITEWQTGPVFTHAYNAAAEQEAVLFVRNEAGQQSAEQRTMRVGGTPPPQLNLLQTAFQRENYGVTLGVLGLLVALGLGVLIVASPQRRRMREREGREERELAYRRVLHRELASDSDPTEVAERLKPLRAVLGIADKEHARIEAEMRATRAAALGSGRALVPGETFLGRYEVVSELGSGGAGRAYLCLDERLGRHVVIKVHRAAGDEATQAALREARAFATVDHECVVGLHDVEQVGDHVFLVLEHVDAGSLAGRLAEGPLPPRDVVRLADDLLGALAAVHHTGLVHRDVKPSNVLIADAGRFKLGDFGIARGDADETAAAGFTPITGTPRYMAPEQARGERVDARSDLYAAGLTLFEAWTGAPYIVSQPGDSAAEVRGRASHGEGSLEGMAATPDLRSFFARALAVDPDDRFEDANAMREAAIAALEGAERRGSGPTS